MNGTDRAATDLVAGVDVSKARLDTQVEPGAATRSFPNDAAGQRAARDWLRRLARKTHQICLQWRLNSC